MSSIALTASMVFGMGMTSLAEGDMEGRWTVNTDGTLSISDKSASDAVGSMSKASLVLIGTKGGTISNLPSGTGITTKMSGDKDAALILYDQALSASEIKETLKAIRFSENVYQVHIDVTEGTTSLDVSTEDATFGILNANDENGEAHAYKYVTFSSEQSRDWISAYHNATTGGGTIGGLKGYLATITTSRESTLVHGFYNKVSAGNTNGGWISATSLRYSTNKNASYDEVKNSLITPGNYEYIANPSQSNHKITGTNGAYYWTDVTSSSSYKDYYYWASGPEKGQVVPASLWASGEPNNYSGGESCAVASYSGASTFNDFPVTQSVPGYFLEFSAYDEGLASGASANSVTIYRVNYSEGDAEEGTAPAAQEKIKGQDLAVDENTGNLSRKGYDLTGWSANEDGSGPVYSADSPYNIDRSTTLYPVWELIPAVAPVISEVSGAELTYGYSEGSISVTAEPDDGAEYGALSYAWYSCNEDGSESEAIPGATSAEYSIEAGLPAGTVAYYYCTVTAERTDNKMTASKDSEVVKVQVLPAKATVTADDLSSKYGDPLKELTASVSGTVGDEKLDVTLSTTATPDSDAGEYPIEVSVKEDPNYDITVVNGTYTITTTDLEVTATGYVGVYDGEEHSIKVDAGDADAEIYYSTTELTEENYLDEGSKEVISVKDAGTVKVYYYVVGTNYDAVKGSKDIEIAKKDLTVTAKDASKKAGEEDPELEAEISGAVEGEKIDYTISREAGEDAGTYAIHVNVSEQPNYSVETKDAVFTIKAADAPIKAEYEVFEGEKVTYYKKSGKVDEIKVRLLADPDNSFDKLKAVKIGDRTLKADEDYTASEGSTIIAVSPSYLDTLELGVYDVTVEFEDGTATAQLTVKDELPAATGNHIPYAALLLTLAGATALVFTSKKRRA